MRVLDVGTIKIIVRFSSTYRHRVKRNRMDLLGIKGTKTHREKLLEVY